MKKAKGKTYRLEVITVRGVRMFFHQKTGRASLCIEYSYDLPLYSTLRLFRQKRILAEAQAVSIGTHAPFEGFAGTFPLVHGPGWSRFNYAERIEAKYRFLEDGDVIVVTIPLRKSSRIWFRKTTRSSIAKALREHDDWPIIQEISRMFPDSSELVDFCVQYDRDSKRRHTWTELLRIARRMFQK